MSTEYQFDEGGSDKRAKENNIFYQLSKIPMPEESFGACDNARNCKNWKVVLGNGYCVKCWDKGLDKRHPKSTKRIKEEGVENIQELQKKERDGKGKYKTVAGDSSVRGIKKVSSFKTIVDNNIYPIKHNYSID